MVPSHRWLRPLYTAIGLALMGLGIVGVVTPGLPGTIFLILALWCFQRGNERWEAWLLNHPRLGPPLREWDATKSLRPRVKVLATTMIVLFSIGSARGLWAESRGVSWTILAVGVVGVVYILSRPTLHAPRSE